MKYFKDANNKLHVIDDEYVNLLPVGCTEISKEESITLSQHVPTIAELKAAKQAQIDAIEAKAYMRRGQRETWLLNVTEKYTAAGYTHAQVYATNPEYKRVYDENVLATQYRSELKVII